jgi:hypothetical protein
MMCPLDYIVYIKGRPGNLSLFIFYVVCVCVCVRPVVFHLLICQLVPIHKCVGMCYVYENGPRYPFF